MWRRLIPIVLFLVLVISVRVSGAEPPVGPRVIGATAWLVEGGSGARMLARVDTGAASCSLHAEEILVPGGSEEMKANKGKKVRFRILDHAGESHWVESKIASTVIVKNAERRERRYKVWVDLVCHGVEKRVCVTLNDRTTMESPALLGRNFLKGDFVVDVAQEATALEPDEAKAENAGDD